MYDGALDRTFFPGSPAFEQGVKPHHQEQGNRIKEKQAGVVVPGLAGEFLIAVLRDHEDGCHAQAIADDRKGNRRYEKNPTFPKAHASRVGPGGRNHQQRHQRADAAAEFIDFQGLPVFIGRKNRGPRRVGAHAADVAEKLCDGDRDVLQWDRRLLDIRNGNAEPDVKDGKRCEEKCFASTQIPDQAGDDEGQRTDADTPLDHPVGEKVEQTADGNQGDALPLALAEGSADVFPLVGKQAEDDQGEKPPVLVACFAIPTIIKHFQECLFPSWSIAGDEQEKKE